MGYRKLHVEGQVYEYAVGSSVVNIKLPAGGSLRPAIHEVKGLRSCDLVERGRWKKTQDGMVTPGEIVDWIRTRHLGLAPVDRSRPREDDPVPDQGEGAYWIRFRNVTNRIAALWTREGGWLLASDRSPLPGTGIVEVIGPVAPVVPDCYLVTAWRNDGMEGVRRVTVGVFAEAGDAKAAQISILERVALELEPILGHRPRPLDAPRAAHAAGLDDVWHVEIEPLRANAVLADVMDGSAYSDAEATRRMLSGRSARRAG